MKEIKSGKWIDHGQARTFWCRDFAALFPPSSTPRRHLTDHGGRVTSYHYRCSSNESIWSAEANAWSHANDDDSSIDDRKWSYEGPHRQWTHRLYQGWWTAIIQFPPSKPIPPPAYPLKPLPAKKRKRKTLFSQLPSMWRLNQTLPPYLIRY